MGLAGAFLTPALVQTENPSLPGLFAYLLVVTAAAMMVVRATAWGWLGWTATLAGALWVLAGTVIGEGFDLWAPALFVPLAAACFLFLLPAEATHSALGRRLAHVPPLALGAALLPLALFEAGLAPGGGHPAARPGRHRGGVEPPAAGAPALADRRPRPGAPAGLGGARLGAHRRAHQHRGRGAAHHPRRLGAGRR